MNPPTQAAAHVQVAGAAPGATASVNLPAGTATIQVPVHGVSAGNFYLLLSVPGTQQRSILGAVK